MIEGLKVDISSAELKAHLEARAAHHNEREAFYQARADDINKGVSTDGEPWDFANSSRGNPADQLAGAAKEHRNRASYFSFMADHIVNEVYRLTEQDYRQLEFVDRYGR